jgi:hypothetical protein
MVRLDHFYRTSQDSELEGDFILQWKGSTIGKANDAKAVVTVNPKENIGADYKSVKYYEQRTGSKDTAVIKQRIWEQIESKSSMPDIILMLERMPHGLVDAGGLLHVSSSSRDIGVRRVAIRKLLQSMNAGNFAYDKVEEKVILQLLDKEEDLLLQELLVKCLHKVREQKQ